MKSSFHGLFICLFLCSHALGSDLVHRSYEYMSVSPGRFAGDYASLGEEGWKLQGCPVDKHKREVTGTRMTKNVRGFAWGYASKCILVREVDSASMVEYKLRARSSVTSDLLEELGAEGWVLGACPVTDYSKDQGGSGFWKNSKGYAWSYSKHCYFWREIIPS